MIMGSGIDIIEIQRIAAALESRRFRQRVFTAAEQTYCDSRQTQRVSSYAARFAAKEAVMKALGTGLAGGRWLDIEIVSAVDTKPTVRLTGYFAAIAREMGTAQIEISLSHCRQFAVAQAIIWGGMNNESCHSRRDASD
ncbi:MAG: holo-ACP synthase [Sporomusaceae bacterium]|nr:holo-ACP synthase [Sporomusaceae bacterium]